MFFLLSIVFLLEGIIGDTFLGYYLSLLWVVFWFVSIKRENWSIKIASNRISWKQLLFLSGFFVFMFLNLSESANIPASVFKINQLMKALIAFFFYLGLKKSRGQYINLFNILQLTGVIYIFLNFWYIFQDNAKQLLPGFNLFYSSYGHNHIVSYLLLIIPYGWLSLLRGYENNKLKISQLIINLLFFVGFVISFSRLAILIYAGELAFIYYFEIFKKGFNQKKRYFVLILISLFLLLGLFFYNSLSHQCLLSKVDDRFCKKASEEGRRYYWERAWNVFSDHVLLGTGIGTYSLVNKKYLQLPGYESSYAHNAYLEFLAEVGLTGSILYWGFFFGRFRQQLENKEKSIEIFHQAIRLGLIASLINNLGDFDFNFFIILAVNFIFLAVSTEDRDDIQRENNVINIKRTIITVIIGLTFFSVLVNSVLNMTTDYLIKIDQPLLAFKINKYSFWHSLVFIQNKEIFAKEFETIKKINWSNPKNIDSILNATSQESERKILINRLRDIDPWNWFNYQRSVNYQAEKVSPDIKDDFLFLIDFMADKKKYNYFFADQEIKARSDDIIFLAKKYYSLQEYETVGEIIEEGTMFNAFLLHHYPSFVYEIGDYSQYQNQISLAQFFFKIDNYGSQSDEYVNYLLSFLNWSISDQNYQFSWEVINKVRSISPWLNWRVGETTILALVNYYHHQSSNFDLSSYLLFAEKFTDLSANEIGSWSLPIREEMAKVLIKIFSSRSTTSFNQINLSKTIGRLIPEESILQALPGYVFLVNGEKDSAFDDFNNCLKVEPENNYCREGLAGLEQTEVDDQKVDQLFFEYYKQKKWPIDF